MEVGYDVLKGIKARHYLNLVKCPGCNWSANWLFAFAGRKFKEEGVCADCFTHMIYELGYRVHIAETPGRKPAKGSA
jgi:hypothetical protein